VVAVVVGGERVAIRAGWAAFDRPLMGAGVQGGVFPRPVVGHRAFDAKEPLVVIGDKSRPANRRYVKSGSAILNGLLSIPRVHAGLQPV
jgi:hypothetical protein